ncbi:Sensor histidine kinase PrrB (RegB) [Rubrivivax sp. A210]|uniref:sensor histidine kinase n=1 Tax=Rubrivivax sp. A210 TaxID=2772301 RepID=UPI00191950C1|nr:HAMP domain-containing sensor histidine kinase [Rubrivivax sp. A210]CAD5369800.1 Sensor histidine kinase PrrB (RegB) [Rubrivivax sp. A210]
MQRLAKLISNWEPWLLPAGAAGAAAASDAETAAAGAALTACRSAADEALTQQRLLIAARMVAITVMALSLAVIDRSPLNQVAITTLAFVVAPFATFNMLGLIRLRRSGGLSDERFARQIMVDIVVLAVLLAVSGGARNPFHDMFFLPVVVAATSLPAARVMRTTAFGVACFWIMGAFNLPLPGDEAMIARLQVVGGFISHTLLAVLLAYFVVHICSSLRQTQLRLTEMHEREVRAGCAVVLGSVAAGAAHELGSPLSTIATVVGDMRDEHRDQPALQRSLEMLQGSVSACLKSLDGLRLAGNTWMSGDGTMAADQVFESVVTRFHSLRPGAQVRLHIETARPAPEIVPDMALQQAVINLLSNAAYVSPQAVYLDVGWTAAELRLRVSDQGPGFPPELAAQLGRACVTGKPPGEGRGVGLFLTQVTITRLDGQLQLSNAQGGGAVAEIRIPLASLRKKEIARGG